MRWITGPLSSPTNGSTPGPDWPRARLVRLTIASCWLRQHAASQVDLVCGASTGPSNAAVSATYHSIVRVRCGRRASPSWLSLCCPLLPSLCSPGVVSREWPFTSAASLAAHDTTARMGLWRATAISFEPLGAARYHPLPGSTPKPERRLSPPQRQRQSRFSLSCFIRARAPHALRVFAPAHTLGCASLPGAWLMS
jgi:hypothetical protein